MRCSGARVFLTPSHVKASLTAAMVVRSLLAALGDVWVIGVLVGWVVVRRELVWPVSVDVVVAVDISTCFVCVRHGVVYWQTNRQRGILSP